MKISAKMKRVQESRAPVEREVGAMWVVGREKGLMGVWFEEDQGAEVEE